MVDRRKIKTYINCDDGETYLIDTIEHEGALWLVPQWRDGPYPHMQRPERIIRMEKAALRDLGVLVDKGPRIHRLADQVPKAVLSGPFPLPADSRFVAVEAPDLVIRR